MAQVHKHDGDPRSRTLVGLLGEAKSEYAGLMRAAPIGTVLIWPASRTVNNGWKNRAELLTPMSKPGRIVELSRLRR